MPELPTYGRCMCGCSSKTHNGRGKCRTIDCKCKKFIHVPYDSGF